MDKNVDEVIMVRRLNDGTPDHPNGFRRIGPVEDQLQADAAQLGAVELERGADVDVEQVIKEIPQEIPDTRAGGHRIRMERLLVGILESSKRVEAAVVAMGEETRTALGEVRVAVTALRLVPETRESDPVETPKTPAKPAADAPAKQKEAAKAAEQRDGVPGIKR